MDIGMGALDGFVVVSGDEMPETSTGIAARTTGMVAKRMGEPEDHTRRHLWLIDSLILTPPSNPTGSLERAAKAKLSNYSGLVCSLF